jgi:hypothetical protein
MQELDSKEYKSMFEDAKILISSMSSCINKKMV